PPAPPPAARPGIGPAVLSDGIHLPGGADVAGFGASDRHDVFVPEPNGWLAGVAALAALSLASAPSPTRRAASRCGGRRARRASTPGPPRSSRAARTGT